MKSLPPSKPTGERLSDLIEPVAMRLAITILLLSTVVPLILIS